MTGDFKLHGQKRSITFPAKITIPDTDAAVGAELSINCKDFGIVRNGKADDLTCEGAVIRSISKGQCKK